MPKICLVAVVDENLGLGFNNQLLCHLPADLRYFKDLTMGKPIIMGKKTFLSIGKPLPGRQNIVLSQQVFSSQGVVIATSLNAALQLTHPAGEVYIIGGAQVFKESLPLADAIYLTLVHHQFQADVFFPKWDESKWIIQSATNRPADDANLYDLTFQYYQRTWP